MIFCVILVGDNIILRKVYDTIAFYQINIQGKIGRDPDGRPSDFADCSSVVLLHRTDPAQHSYDLLDRRRSADRRNALF